MPSSSGEEAIGTRSADARLGGVAAIAWLIALATALTIWTWGRLGDLLTDTGRSLYTAWQVSEGRGADNLHFVLGPISPHLDAIFFSLLGRNITAYEIGNGIVLALISALLLFVLVRAGGWFAATVASTVFLAIFAFGNLTRIGNYNYLTPYTPAITQGLAMALTAGACTIAYTRRGHARRLIGAGLACGVALVTKPEMFVAAGVVAAIGPLVAARQRGWSAAARAAAIIAACTGAVPIICAVTLWHGMSISRAWAVTFNALDFRTSAQAAHMPAYRWGMGLDDLGQSLQIIAADCAAYAGIIGAGIVLAFALRRPSRWRRPAAIAIGIAVAGLILAESARINWADAFRGLLIIAGVAAAWQCACVARTDGRLDTATSRLVLAVLGLALLPKIAFNARLYHYGFVLAMPAAMTAIVALLAWIPVAIDRIGGWGRAFTIWSTAIVLAVCVVHLRIANSLLQMRTVPIIAGRDRILADPATAEFFAKSLAELRNGAVANDSLAVFPENPMFNYLSRIPNPTPYFTGNPVDLALVGEDTVLAALEAHPPRRIALVGADYSDYGGAQFGVTYARSIGKWITEKYRPVWRLDIPRGEGVWLRAAILERNVATSQP